MVLDDLPLKGMVDVLFEKERKIFQYHFPGYPLFPGALLLDYYISEHESSSEMNKHNYSIKFLHPLLPDETFHFAKSKQKNHKQVVMEHEDKVFAKLLIDERKEQRNIDQINLKDNEYKGKQKKPMANHAKEILFLDHWYEIKNSEEGITAVGQYTYKKEDVKFLEEISEEKNFGQIFVLIELMGLTALSSLVSNKVIDLTDNYGFARLTGFEMLHNMKDQSVLTAVVKSRRLGEAFIWSGYVLCDNVLIAFLSQGINLPLR